MDPDDQSNIPQNKYPIRVQVVGASGEQITSFGGGSGGGDVNITELDGTAVATGAGNVNSGTQRIVLATDQVLPLPTGAATSANQTNGTQQVKITDGTNLVGVLKSDGTVLGQNAQLVGGTGYTTATVSLSAGTPSSSWFDMLNYAWVSVEILTNTTPATITFQTSGDASQTNITSMNMITGSGTSFVTSTTSTTATLHGPRSGRYFRISTNLAGGNTATFVLTFFTNASFGPAVFASQVTSPWLVGGDTAAGATDAGNPIKVGGKNNSTKPTLTDGQRGNLELDTRGNLEVSLWSANNATPATFKADNADGVAGSSTAGSLQVVSRVTIANGSNWDRQSTVVNATNSTGTGIAAAGILAQLDDTSPTTITENQFGNLRMTTARSLMVENRYTYGRVTADGQIGTSAKFLHTISIAPTGSVTAGVLTVYDNTAESGTVIYSVSLPVTTFTPFTVKLDVDTTTGIYVGFDATLANVQATVSYRT